MAKFQSFKPTPAEMLERIVRQTRQAREEAGLSRQELSERTGISASTYKHFEDTGQISLERLLKVAEALDCLEAFGDLFAAPPPEGERFESLDEVEQTYGEQGGKTHRKGKG